MDQICKLTHLEVLDLQYTHLKKLPDAIKNLSNLIHLDLSKNQLDALPDSIDQLFQLAGVYNTCGIENENFKI